MNMNDKICEDNVPEIEGMNGEHSKSDEAE
jgi:hypothetical protein